MKALLYKHVYPALAWLFIHGISASVRVRVIGGAAVEDLFRKGERLIFSFWHGRHFLVIQFLRRKQADVMVSPSRDGALIASVLMHSGYGIVFGSSHKSPARALIGAVRRVREGRNLLVTVDGPKGPIHEVKPGAVFVAKKSDAWIVPLTISARPSVTMRSWDRYQIPLPFARAVVLFGRPYRLDKDTDQADVKKACARLGDVLSGLTDKADRLLKT